MPSASPTTAARVAASVLPSLASSCAAAAATNGGPPSGPAARRPAQRASSMAGAIPRRRDAPTRPETDARGRRGGRQDFVRPADARGPQMAAPYASRAARDSARLSARATLPARPPEHVYVASSPQSAAHRGAAGVRRSRRNAPRPGAGRQSARSATPGAGRRGYAWIVRLPLSPLRAVRAARTAPTCARRLGKPCRTGRRKSP